MTAPTLATVAPEQGAAAPPCAWGVAYRTDLDATGRYTSPLCPGVRDWPTRLAEHGARQCLAELRTGPPVLGLDPAGWHLVRLDVDGTWRIHTDNIPGDAR